MAELRGMSDHGGELVYYVGQKIGRTGKHDNWQAYVDDRGWYQSKEGDHLAYRYEILSSKAIGEGSNARVFKAFDHKRCCLVAIKVGKQGHLFNARREVEMLQWIQLDKPLGAEHIIVLEESFLFRGAIFLVFPLAAGTLHDAVLSAPSSGKKLSVDVVQPIARQLMQALVCLQRKGLVHGDIKSDNVTVMNQQPTPDALKLEVVLIDLGSAMFVPLSRAHRDLSPLGAISCKAPEALLELEWGSAIDMWSVGILVFYIVTGEHLVNPRVSDHFDALRQQVTVLGFPTKPVVDRWRKEWSLRPTSATDLEARLFPNSTLTTRMHSRNASDLSLHDKLEQTALGDNNSVKLLEQFLSACLDWDPATRMTPNDALQHPFLQCSGT